MNPISRRDWIRATSIGIGGLSMSGWLPALADQLGADPRRRRHAILLWMSGGPTQTDTFDMKPDHENGGEFKEIATNVPGVRFSEHLPKLAKHADKLAIVRSLSTKEGDHGRGTHLMRTGHPPMGATRYPAIGAALAKELGSEADPLPHYVSIGPYRALSREAFGPGFLGPKYAPLVVGATDVAGAFTPQNDANEFAQLKIESVRPPKGVSDERMAKRLELWSQMQDRFVGHHPGGAAVAQQTVYRRAVQLMNSQAAKAFDLSEEPTKTREAYGKGLFGQGCLMARRLIEQGVPFVEVTLGGSGGVGWDTHVNNFETVKQLSGELDAGWATLMEELDQRGLLDLTTIIWMGEFGRTPSINGNVGRDHFPQAWTCVLGGGGIAGGQAYGRTSEDGMKVEENKVGVGDILATLCQAVGVPPYTENISDAGRPLKIVDEKDGVPINEILA